MFSIKILYVSTVLILYETRANNPPSNPQTTAIIIPAVSRSLKSKPAVNGSIAWPIYTHIKVQEDANRVFPGQREHSSLNPAGTTAPLVSPVVRLAAHINKADGNTSDTINTAAEPNMEYIIYLSVFIGNAGIVKRDTDEPNHMREIASGPNAGLLKPTVI